MSKAPFFTVVLPTYNRARMAAAALLSLLGQSERDFECFVIDDGSADDTQRVLAALPEDSRVRMLKMGENRGQHVCRNRAIKESAGRFITFLDSDDMYLPGRLAAFRKAAESRPGTGFWFSNAYVMRFGRVIGRLFDPEREIPEGKVPGHYAMGDSYLPYLTTNLAIRREAFDEFGLYREDRKILEDTELYAKMLAGGLKTGVIRAPLAVRGIHGEQITADFEKDFEEAALALEAGKPDPETFKRRRRELALEVAQYLLKSLEPGKARELLRREFGEDAPRLRLYLQTFVPRPALGMLKDVRERWLRLRYAYPFAPMEFIRAYRAVRPYLDFAARL